MPIQAYILYIVGSLAVAWLGTHRKFGFWGYLFASLLFSPIVGVLLVVASDKRPALEAARPTGEVPRSTVSAG